MEVLHSVKNTHSKSKKVALSISKIEAMTTSINGLKVCYLHSALIIVERMERIYSEYARACKEKRDTKELELILPNASELQEIFGILHIALQNAYDVVDDIQEKLKS